MTPVGLLAIVALGMMLAYVIPQRARERAEYALVRTEDRFSADMRVVKATAARVETARQATGSTSGEVPLLVTGEARASVAALGASHVSRPATPLDRAATLAQRERLSMRRDRAAILAERRAQARRRARVTASAGALSVVAWIVVAATAFPAVVAAIVSAGFAGLVVVGARTAHAQRKADSHVLAVAREVEAAATATQALRRVSRDRSRGEESMPSDLETQAIKVVTTENLAPLTAPSPKVERPAARAEAQEAATTGSIPQASSIIDGDAFADDEDEAGWSPQAMPAPAYTLKPTVRQRQARPIDEDDYTRAAAVAQRWADERYGKAEEQPVAEERPAASGSLEQILARRRASA
ncbi:hypothetical protein [Demequina zhanjiangensis]|uniref:Uncharacterized protein n=1 Tax=Demequina zhanjiangensis TaxID=3051659 RepID=A0ABT8FYE0_9MICO|nr:hypothetical protein [Demequina sp. SYSU T00b26]MDN4471911.1 hypothetical protein [Demequina sp. SYSU T00b26]